LEIESISTDLISHAYFPFISGNLAWGYTNTTALLTTKESDNALTIENESNSENLDNTDACLKNGLVLSIQKVVDVIEKYFTSYENPNIADLAQLNTIQTTTKTSFQLLNMMSPAPVPVSTTVSISFDLSPDNLMQTMNNLNATIQSAINSLTTAVPPATPQQTTLNDNNDGENAQQPTVIIYNHR
jgi:hypothetical protein